MYLSSLVRKIKSDDTLTNFAKLYGIAQAATQNITLSDNFANPDTLVSVALVLKNIPLENIVLVQYPSKTGGTGIFAGKVQPITSVANALFAAIKADLPIGARRELARGRPRRLDARPERAGADRRLRSIRRPRRPSPPRLRRPSWCPA